MHDDITINSELAEILRWRRPFPIPDPAPDWIFKHLDRKQLIRMAMVELEFKNKITEASIEANNKVMEILKGIE